MFINGDIVKIRPEWCDRKEGTRERYIVTNVNEITKRCYIRSITSKLPFPGEELVGFDMIELVAAERMIFAVRFNRKDGQAPEEYEYHNRDNAEQHFELFRDDNSGLYSNIELTETRIGLPEILLDRLCFCGELVREPGGLDVKIALAEAVREDGCFGHCEHEAEER